jgi:uncharacterized protein
MSQVARVLSVLMLIVGAAPGAASQEPPARQPPRPSIRVTGEAVVTVNPDQARIEIGVISQAESAQAAATQNAQRVDSVLSDLRRILGSSADIKTISYSVSPNYRYPKEGGKPTIVGHTASNVLRVTINDLSLVGKVIDTATQSGANTIQRLQFTLKDEKKTQAEALSQAAVIARAKADSIASALGVKVLRILLVEEAGSAVPVIQERVFAMARADAAAPPTPVEPGTIDIRAVVTLTVEIAGGS